MSIELDIQTDDSMSLGQQVELGGSWRGTIERDPERYLGLGGVILRLEPTHAYDATMKVGPTKLRAHRRHTPSNVVWREEAK